MPPGSPPAYPVPPHLLSMHIRKPDVHQEDRCRPGSVSVFYRYILPLFLQHVQSPAGYTFTAPENGNNLLWEKERRLPAAEKNGGFLLFHP